MRLVEVLLGLVAGLDDLGVVRAAGLLVNGVLALRQGRLDLVRVVGGALLRRAKQAFQLAEQCH